MYADGTSINFNSEDFNLKCAGAEFNNKVGRVKLKLNKLSLSIKTTRSIIYHQKIKEKNVSIDNI